MEAIGQLTGGIAHDFNNILQSIVGYVVLAEERQDELDDPRLGGYLARIHASTRRASELIGQMLTFSRGQRGERRPCARAAGGEATQMLRSTLPSTIALRTMPPPMCRGAGRPGAVRAGAAQSLDQRPRCDARAGEILVSTGVTGVHDAVCASCRKRSGDFVELAVRDSGPGIPRRSRSAFSSRSSRPRKWARAAAWVSRWFTASSTITAATCCSTPPPAAGTTVRVLFPPSRRAGAVERTAGRRPPKPRLRGRVLVADDEAAVRELLRELLTGWGLDVALARTGAEAAAAFAAEPAASTWCSPTRRCPK